MTQNATNLEPGSLSLVSGRPRMPRLFDVAVAVWGIMFILLILSLALLYIALVVFSTGKIFELWRDPRSQDTDYFMPVLAIITGSFLLLIMIKILLTKQLPRAVLIKPGTFPALERLVMECADKANTTHPDAIFVIPQANAFAYSSGKFAEKNGVHNFVMIGAALLVYLGRDDLEAILYHEYGHLFLRQRLWSVNLSNKMHDFLPRFRLAHLYGQGCALVITLIPALMIKAFEVLFVSSMSYFSRQEELLVDQFAARIMGAARFRTSLVRAITVITAFDAKTHKSHSLSSLINAEFYRRLLLFHSDPAVCPNWFSIARRAPMEQQENFETRAKLALLTLQQTRTALFGSHPSLPVRISKLDTDLHSHSFEPAVTTDRLESNSDIEEMISTAFRSELRDFFYNVNLRLGKSPVNTIDERSVVPFECRYSGCPRNGEVELVLTQRHLRICKANTDELIPWDEIKSIETVNESQSNFFLTSARSYMAVLRGAPSNRKMVLKRKRGGSITLDHWHFVENVPEVETLVNGLWKRRARFTLVK